MLLQKISSQGINDFSVFCFSDQEGGNVVFVKGDTNNSKQRKRNV